MEIGRFSIRFPSLNENASQTTNAGTSTPREWLPLHLMCVSLPNIRILRPTLKSCSHASQKLIGTEQIHVHFSFFTSPTNTTRMAEWKIHQRWETYLTSP